MDVIEIDVDRGQCNLGIIFKHGWSVLLGFVLLFFMQIVWSAVFMKYRSDNTEFPKVFKGI